MKYKVLEYVALGVALPFMTISFIVGVIYGGLLAGFALAKEAL